MIYTMCRRRVHRGFHLGHVLAHIRDRLFVRSTPRIKRVELVALGEQLVELGLAADRAQRGLRELGGGKEVVGDLGYGARRIEPRKYSTALTFMVILSRVITSLGGMSSVTVRRSMRADQVK